MTELCLQPGLQLPRPAPLTSEDALLSDFDGTLVAIAARPDAVAVAPYLPQLLWRTRGALRDALAIVTGRTIADVDRFTKSTVMTVAGVHGLELRGPQGLVRASRSIHTALPELRAELEALKRRRPGVLVEDKGAAVALHYRQAPEAEAECRTLATAAAARAADDCSVLEGRSVIELKRRGHDKGAAVRDIMAQPPFQGRRPVFVGDDLTDEAAFGAVLDLGGVAVVVGARWPTAAGHALPSVHEVHAWIGHVRPPERRRAAPAAAGSAT